MMADKELDRGGWPTDKFVLLPRTRIIVSLLVANDILEIARFEDAYGKETLPTFGVDGIPSDLIKAHRAGIDRIKEELRNIPPR